MSDGASVALRVNGAPRTAGVAPGWRLLDLLREGLHLVGTKEGCDDGTCGTCTVQVDGEMVRACRVSAGEMAGKDVLTIEGMGTAERPHALQEAFVEADAVQCGFCTPGMIMAAAALLARNPRPSREEIVRRMGSNLCRCTGYRSIIDAVEWVAAGRRGSPRTWPFAARPGARRLGALEKATGAAVYAADIQIDGMLHARALRSPHAHALILGIDTERARALPGVVAVLTAGDIPGENSYGRFLKDQTVLADSKVRQVGDPIAVVAATSLEAADAALALITVRYGPLPAVFDPAEALAGGAPLIHPGGNLLAENALRQGDVAEGFARADVVIDERYTTPWNEHAYLEPEAAVAHPDGDTIVVRTATQHPHYHRAEVARTLGWPDERVRVVPTVIGGAFGGKTDISCQCLVALLAAKTGRPVKMVYTRAESFASTPKRHPFWIHCRTGVTRDGRFTALQMELLADTGAYASSGPGRMIKAFPSATGPYRWPAIDLHGRVVYTNNPTAGSMRGPGTTQVVFALESQLDLMAERLGMDPLELRLRNRLRQGDVLPSGQILERDPAYALTLEAVRPHYAEALARCAAARDLPGTKRRGVGIASLWYGIGGGGGKARLPGRAALDLMRDGTVALRTGAVDLGQGSDTALGLIAAEELGLRPADVKVQAGDTQTTSDTGATAGSKVTFFVGNAV
ncbi:MAG: molybdopterin-dependent oxidoreductase, partial [Candidatus Limnocylindria bacterium]|nr:molybdopterin-dependent oxidoreductase [Candidatus Limnocylindria bacterium]